MGILENVLTTTFWYRFHVAIQTTQIDGTCRCLQQQEGQGESGKDEAPLIHGQGHGRGHSGDVVGVAAATPDASN